MRVIVATADDAVGTWLRDVLSSAGLSVVVLDSVSPEAPELHGSDLLIADRPSVNAIGMAGPTRRMLLVSRGAFVDVSSALQAGFLDLVVVPAPEDEVLARVGRCVDRLLRPARPAPAPRARTAELKALVLRVVNALQRSSDDGAATNELSQGMLSVFLLLVDAHDTAERSAPGHSRKVAALVGGMAARIGMPSSAAAWLEMVARVQDIGMLPLHMPLSDPAPLSRELRRTLIEHPVVSAEILTPLAVWGLPVEAVRGHHERVDGSGYPNRLSGAAVSPEAQILGAADVFAALTSARPWRPAELPASALDAMRTLGAFAVDVLDLVREAARDARALPARPAAVPA